MQAHYDPFSNDVIHGDTHAIYRRLRDEAPVYRLEKWDAWALSRFEDVWWACANPTLSSASGATTAHLLTKVQPVLPLLNNMDPPDHTALRARLRRYFMPARVRALEPTMRSVVVECLERMGPSGRHDVVAELAQPLAMAVGCATIGLPIEDGEYLRDLVERFFRRAPGQEGMTEEGLAAMLEMNQYLEDQSARQRATPPETPNAIGELHAFRDSKGASLSDADVGSHLSLLLIGGTDTLPKVLASLLLRLFQHPDQRAEVARDPALLRPAFNEAVRIDMPTQNMCRLLTEDLERHGTVMKAGQPVVLLYASANRDEREFPDPDRFDIHRGASRSLSFSHGSHACIGLHLARKEGEVALGEILARHPDFVVDESSLERYATEFVQGYSSMTVEWRGEGSAR